jgi:hypothetical protein
MSQAVQSGETGGGADFWLPAFLPPGWEGCQLKQHQTVARALQKLLHKPFRISEAFATVSGPFWTARKRSQALSAECSPETAA